MEKAKRAGKEEHIVEQHRLDAEQWETARKMTAERKAQAPQVVQEMWQKSQYVKDYKPPEPIGFKWKSRCGCFVV